jgi:hypothetical protein
MDGGIERMRLRGILAGLIVFLAATATLARQSSGPAREPSQAPANPAPVPVKTQIRNVDFHFTDRIVVHISALDGSLTPNESGIPVFDDKQSFTLDMDSAQITVSTAALTNDLNEYVFARPLAPIKDLKVKTENNDLAISGLLVGKGAIPFEAVGTVSLTPEGLIRLHTTKVKALHLPVKGLMDLLGLDTAQLINTKKIQGITADKDDLILDPENILPPPRLHGRLTAIRIQNDAMVLTFGTPGQREQRAQAVSTCGRRNFMSFKGGPVRFGKLEMDEADLELFNSGSENSFDFSIDHYKDQLVAGYSKINPRGGLCVHMPEYYSIQQNIQANR